MEISLTMSPNRGVDGAAAAGWVSTADAGWDVTIDGDDGIVRKFELNLSLVSRRGDLRLKNCVPSVCTTGLGAATVGGPGVWYSASGRADTPTHEMGHIFGFANNRAPGAGSIMSGDRPRAINQRDFDLLWDAYKR